MMIRGEALRGILKDGMVLVPSAPDANRIYDRGRLGEPQPGGGLLLHPLEAAYLVESRGLEVMDESHGGSSAGPVEMIDLVSMAGGGSKRDEHASRAWDATALEIFTVFRDLRRSGLPAFFPRPPSRYHHLDLFERGAARRGALTTGRLTVFSENCFPGLAELTRMTGRTSSLGKTHVAAVVDSDMDITYYSLVTLTAGELGDFDFSGLLERSEGYEVNGGRELPEEITRPYSKHPGGRDHGAAQTEAPYTGNTGDPDSKKDHTGKGCPGTGIRKGKMQEVSSKVAVTVIGPGLIVKDKLLADRISGHYHAGSSIGDGLLYLTLPETLWLEEEGVIKPQTGAHARSGGSVDGGVDSGVDGDGNAARLCNLQGRPVDMGLCSLYGRLRGAGLIPRTGFKYGAHFRVYVEPPERVHAPFIVHMVRGDDRGFGWMEFSRGVRLAHAVKKIMLFTGPGEGDLFLAAVRRRP